MERILERERERELERERERNEGEIRWPVIDATGLVSCESL